MMEMIDIDDNDDGNDNVDDNDEHFQVRRECSSVETQKCSQPQAEQVLMI